MLKLTLRIHPAIGVARVGNSTTHHFVGPEVPGSVELPAGGYKDPLGRIKPQGCRFRVFAYVNGKNPVEVLVDGPDAIAAKIAWSVVLGHAKPAATPYSLKNLNSRNPLPTITQGGATQKLKGTSTTSVVSEGGKPPAAAVLPPIVLDFGQVAPGYKNSPAYSKYEDQKSSLSNAGLTGLEQMAKEMAKSQSNKVSVQPGTAYTDTSGALVVVGGDGAAVTPKSLESFAYTQTSGDLDYGKLLISLFDNPFWADGTSDGSVAATVTLDKAKVLAKLSVNLSDTTVEAVGAWVVVAPPDYAPGIRNVITMQDTLEEGLATDAMLKSIAADTWLERDIEPLLRAAARVRWVNRATFAGFAWKSTANKSPHGALIPSNTKGYSGMPDQTRAFILASLKPPADLPAEVTKLATDTIAKWPKLVGALSKLQNMPIITGGAGANALAADFAAGKTDKHVVALTRVQYTRLVYWAAGKLPAGAPPPLTKPEAMDRAAMDQILSGLLGPGIEVPHLEGFSAGDRDESLFVATSGPDRFRLQAAYDATTGKGNWKKALHKDKDYDWKNGLEPGYLTMNLALPWQIDYEACGDFAWPAQRPAQVVPSNEAISGGKPKAAIAAQDFKEWDRGIGQSWRMIQRWRLLGFVVPQEGAPEDRFVEVGATADANDAGLYSPDLLTPELDFGVVPAGLYGTQNAVARAITFRIPPAYVPDEFDYLKLRTWVVDNIKTEAKAGPVKAGGLAGLMVGGISIQVEQPDVSDAGSVVPVPYTQSIEVDPSVQTVTYDGAKADGESPRLLHFIARYFTLAPADPKLAAGPAGLEEGVVQISAHPNKPPGSTGEVAGKPDAAAAFDELLAELSQPSQLPSQTQWLKWQVKVKAKTGPADRLLAVVALNATTAMPPVALAAARFLASRLIFALGPGAAVFLSAVRCNDGGLGLAEIGKSIVPPLPVFAGVPGKPQPAGVTQSLLNLAGVISKLSGDTSGQCYSPSAAMTEVDKLVDKYAAALPEALKAAGAKWPATAPPKIRSQAVFFTSDSDANGPVEATLGPGRLVVIFQSKPASDLPAKLQLLASAQGGRLFLLSATETAEIASSIPSAMAMAGLKLVAQLSAEVIGLQTIVDPVTHIAAGATHDCEFAVCEDDSLVVVRVLGPAVDRIDMQLTRPDGRNLPGNQLVDWASPGQRTLMFRTGSLTYRRSSEVFGGWGLSLSVREPTGSARSRWSSDLRATAHEPDGAVVAYAVQCISRVTMSARVEPPGSDDLAAVHVELKRDGLPDDRRASVVGHATLSGGVMRALRFVDEGRGVHSAMVRVPPGAVARVQLHASGSDASGHGFRREDELVIVGRPPATTARGPRRQQEER